MILGVSLVIVYLLGNGFGTIINIFFWIVMGVQANDLYMKKLEEHIEILKKLSDEYKSQYIFKHSGVDVVAALLSVAIYILLLAIAIISKSRFI